MVSDVSDFSWVQPVVTGASAALGSAIAGGVAVGVGIANRKADRRKRRIDRFNDALDRLEAAYAKNHRPPANPATDRAAELELTDAVRAFGRAVDLVGSRWVADRAEQFAITLRNYYLFLDTPRDPLDIELPAPNANELRERSNALTLAMRQYEESGR